MIDAGPSLSDESCWARPAAEAVSDFVSQRLAAFGQTSLEQRLGKGSLEAAQPQILALFHQVAHRVPAYRDFLATHGVDPARIQTWQEFETLPRVQKDNYTLQYPLPQLCWDGRLAGCDMMAVSSGSTGVPSFWPRFVSDELEIATRFEQVFCDAFEADQRTTLAVVCFALGTWVGGMYTADCCRHLAAKGYPITVVTPGNNLEEIFRVVAALGPQYDQVVLLGYPPFLKGVVDTGLARGLRWADYRVKWVMAGEVFSEEWRTLMGQRLGASDPCFDSASLYGTADAGVLGNETPLSIAIRRWLAQAPEVAAQLFGESRLPTLVQYDPASRYFEVTPEGTLLFSGNNGIPLIRYHIADTGGVMDYPTMMAFLAGHGFDPLSQLAGRRGVRPLPFVWVFGRSNFTISYFGANIFPENVTVGLEQPGIQEWVTGKFVLESREDADRNRYLQLTVELAPGEAANAERAEAIAQSVQAQLLRLNSEFAHYVPTASQRPQVTLLPTGDPDYFPVGVKHRYTRPSQIA
jgi:phenylacetate-CoA ligase